MKKRISLLLIFSTIFLLSFSIITNQTGYFRKYNLEDIPMVITLHESIMEHEGWYEAVTGAAYEWNELPGAYFEFEFGGLTTVNEYTYDGINLMYFDNNYDYFEEGSSVIAFSGTWTEGDGAAYHALESDFIYNAAGNPPSITGEPDKIDLYSTSIHEFGHHLGLGHTGDAGNSQPGLGEVIEDAVMYYAIANGDTSRRHLHIHDMMGAISIYPRIKFTGTLTNTTGETIPNGYINIDGDTQAAYYTDPQFLYKWQRGGYVTNDTIHANADGTYSFVTTSYNFEATFFSPGYESVTEIYNLGETSSEIELIENRDIVLPALPPCNIQYAVLEENTEQPVNGIINFYFANDPAGSVFSSVDLTDGVINIQLPAGIYNMEIIADIPYEYKYLDEIEFSTDFNETIFLKKAQILLVDQDYQDTMDDGLGREDYYFRILQNMEETFAFTYHEEYSKGFAPEQDDMNVYDAVIWYTGDNPDPVLDTEYTNLLSVYLETGGNLFMTGQNILSSNAANTFLQNYLNVDYNSDGPTTNKTLYVNNGNLITGEWMFMQFNGAAGANNQYSTDVLTLMDSSCEEIFFYHPSNAGLTAGMYYEDNTYGYKVVFLGCGLEAIINLMQPNDGLETRIQFMENVFEYFNMEPMAIDDDSDENNIAKNFQLKQNYPNPFNPETTIEYILPKATNVELTIYNSMGQVVKTLVDQQQTAKTYQVKWNGTSDKGKVVSSGLYYYRLKAGNTIIVNKMLFLK